MVGELRNLLRLGQNRTLRDYLNIEYRAIYDTDYNCKYVVRRLDASLTNLESSLPDPLTFYFCDQDHYPQNDHDILMIAMNPTTTQAQN